MASWVKEQWNKTKAGVNQIVNKLKKASAPDIDGPERGHQVQCGISTQTLGQIFLMNRISG